MARKRKVMVVGSGAREHALSERLLDADSVSEVIVTPGLSGVAPRARLHSRPGKPLEVALAERPDLVVIGPEAPLCEGLVDELEAAGIRAFGPNRSAARLEGSKAFMKAFAERAGIRTARFETVRDVAAAERAIGAFPNPPVVKADGLCAGKGVIVAKTHDEALAAAREMLSGERFGDAGKTVVIEERIHGPEASMHAICDGERFVVLPAAQDHKRLGDGDTGPNTGGMGAYAPAPIVTAERFQRFEKDVFERAFRAMADSGTPYRGALFANMIIPDDGTEPVLLEFNARFGDPETQVLMAVTGGDLAEALDSAARGALGKDALPVLDRSAVCVVLAVAGYPEAPRKGDVIEGVSKAEAVEGVRVYQAGTALDGDRLTTASGRVLAVTAHAPTLREAHARAYRAVDEIHFSGMQFRRDIAARALG
jgi:phosphoribosylamine---glycine ligase